MEQAKAFKLVFPDYSASEFALADGIIQNINLYKKTKKLEIYLLTDSSISMREISSFEKYAKARFEIKVVEFKNTIKKDEIEKIEFLLNDWENIAKYMQDRVPIIKAFMKDSSVELIDKTLRVNICVKGKDLLLKEKFDQRIAGFINNIYDVNIKLEFNEVNCQKTEEEFKELKAKMIEDYSRAAIKLIQENENKPKKPKTNLDSLDREIEAQAALEGKMASENLPFDIEIENLSGEPITASVEGNIPKAKLENIKPEDENLIYGRSSRLRFEEIKIENIGMDTSNCRIAGEVVNVPDPMELKKTGKFLISFDLYDGTSSITCKIFAAPEQKDKVLSKIKPIVQILFSRM